MLFSRKPAMPTAQTALPGRAEELPTATTHHVLKTPLKGPHPEGAETVFFALGCFWGAERKFWALGDGIVTTAVGYQGGFTPNATYEEVCTGHTGHTEVVMVVYEPGKISFEALLKVFFESHDPTQGNRQGNDVGTQYRSAIYTTTDAQLATARAAKAAYETALLCRGFSAITTEIAAAPTFYFAEDYHQQYLAKVPNGYCGLGGTGVACPVGLDEPEAAASA
ncbi:MAG: peptide-methionine (S)-S-oxide reductase MsrA [Pseudomonadota bacterium]